MSATVAVLSVALFYGCAPLPRLPGAQESESQHAPVLPTAPVSAESTPPVDWHLQDRNQDGVLGTSWIRAERELLLTLRPRRTVVIAIVDDGVDSTSRGLRTLLWQNRRERSGNRIDDDGDGFVDDVFGWNFIGSSEGTDVTDDTFEVTRLARICTGFAGVSGQVSQDECARVRNDFMLRRADAQRRLASLVANQSELVRLHEQIGDSAESRSTVADIRARKPATLAGREARRALLDLAASGVTIEKVSRARDRFESFVRFGYNGDFDSRSIVGDDYPDTLQRVYGNARALLTHNSHGSTMAILVAGLRKTSSAMRPRRIELMSLRVVPNGDERDKDVALAIRYAVSHGAQIVNMSFGKPYSPGKAFVDQEVRRGIDAGVLFVHAAGNDGRDISTAPNFPTARYIGGAIAQNWIEVGASGWHDGQEIAAGFSNYSRSTVDIFAPGVDIGAIGVDGDGGGADGTSAAAAIVSGIAALLFEYFPQLSAKDVRSIIVESATQFPDRIVEKPGGRMVEVEFGELSSSGGLVNALAAVREAIRRTRHP